MVARRKDASAALPEAGDALAVGGAEPVAWVHGEEPEFVEPAFIQTAQYGIVTFGIGFAIAGGNFVEEMLLVVLERCEVFAQQGKTIDVPIVFGLGNRGLQQNADWSRHKDTVPQM